MIRSSHASKTLPRNKRLNRAKQRIPQYEGQHLLKAHRKRYGVDRLTAIEDLFLLGMIDEGKRDVLRKQELDRQALVRRQREEKKAAEWAAFHADQNERFFYIVGYTSGGAPYGVTWEEMGLVPWEEIE